MDKNPYAAPLEHNEQFAQRSRFAVLVDLIWAFCAGLPFVWLGTLFCIFLVRGGGNLPPTIAVRLTAYITLCVCLLLCLISFVYNTMAALKRRWVGICGVIINVLSFALVLGVVALIVFVIK
jgi:hypothetical protein